MSTIQKLPHSEYSSGRTVNNSSPTGQKQNTERQNSNTGNSIISTSASLKEEHSLLLGMFNDILKTLAKILTGSLLTDVLKSLLKDGNQTWQAAIYNNCIDSFPSRFFTDVANSFAVRFLNGNHTFFGLFKLPYIAPELSSQILSPPIVSFFRAATTSFNVNAESAAKDISEEEQAIKNELERQNRWLYRSSKNLKEKFNANVKPVFDKALRFLLGIKAGSPILDKEGNEVIDKEGKIIKEKGKTIYSNQKINMAHLGAVVSGTLVGSFFLPQHTTAFGFEKATNLLRAFIATATTSLFRLNTTLLHNGFGMHFKSGNNFDKCFRTSVVEKMLVPLTQYACDAAGVILSKHMKINGAFLAIIMRLLTEVPATFLSTALVNVAGKDRLNNDWKYLAHKIWKPVADLLETTLKPAYKLIAKYIYGYLFGMYDPRIPNMYGVDIRKDYIKQRDILEPEVAEKHKSGSANTAKLFAKKLIDLPIKDSIELLGRCKKHAVKREKKISDKLTTVNHSIDIKNEAHQALKQAGLEKVIQVDKDSPEFNSQLIELAKKEDLKIDSIKALIQKNGHQQEENLATAA